MVQTLEQYTSGWLDYLNLELKEGEYRSFRVRALEYNISRYLFDAWNKGSLVSLEVGMIM